VALPIISACGVETAVLPSAILSTHTGGFTGWTFQDLTKEMLPISEHWRVADIRFDAFYTGYLGSIEQINMVKHIMDTNGVDGAIRVVDPAMADNGALYPGFNMEFVDAMKDLCAHADVLLPNMTEACMLTDTEYSENIDRETVELLCKKL
jgi:pyridoxine kinase